MGGKSIVPLGLQFSDESTRKDVKDNKLSKFLSIFNDL